MQKSLIILIALLICCTANISLAKTKKKRVPTPSVLLVKLPTYSNRIAVYRKAHNDKYANQCIADAKAMQLEIIKDFKENFKFCNYYFFYDTCSDLIITGKFNNILYHKDLSLVTQEIIELDDTTFQIAYFGNYINTSGIIEGTNKPVDSHNNPYFEATKKQRLVVVDRKFQNLPDPAPNGANMQYSVFFNKYPSIKTYKSKLFDIYYVRYAGLISSDMNDYYKKK